MPAVTRNTPRLSLEGAQIILAAAQTRAAEIKVPMDIAVVDDGGHLLAFARMVGAKISSVEIAIRKEHCAAIRRLPSGPSHARDEVTVLLSLGLSVASQGRQIPLRGGIPLQVDGVCVGAIGVSNGSEDQDVDVAQAGGRALNTALDTKS
jgi:glc operon protein GlcG